MHGWGGNLNSLNIVKDEFKNRMCISVDFFGHGNTKEPEKESSIFDEAENVVKLLRELKVYNCDVVAHSYGVRIALIIASYYPSLISKMVLFGPAGLKAKKSLRVRLSILRYKRLVKKYAGDSVKLSKLGKMGSEEYVALSPQMKYLFKSAVNTDLSKHAKIIKAKTLIICGENDTATTPKMAKRLHKLIKFSTLKIVKNAGHYVFLDSIEAVKLAYFYLN